MSVVNEAEWQSYLPQYQELKQRLEAADWFVANDWQYTIVLDEASGIISSQLSKPSWYNQNRNGVHFDCWLGQKQLDEGAVPIALHAHQDFPNGPKLCGLFIERSKDLVGQWQDFNLFPGNPFQPISTKVVFTKDTLVTELAAQFARIQQLGVIIDKAIEEALT
jgi:hypothetical protein